MAVSDSIKDEIRHLFSSFSDNIIPAETKDLVDETLSIIKNIGGPEITLQYDETSNGYLPVYNGTVYNADEAEVLITDFENSPFKSSSVFYGTLGPADEADGQYSLAHFVERVSTELSMAGKQVTVRGNSLVFPGSQMVLSAAESDGTSCPLLYLALGPYKVSVVPSEDEWLEANPRSSLEGYKYVNYQVVKSDDGDVIFKAYLSDSPTGEGDQSEIFKDVSINHYCTDNSVFNYPSPRVHHAAESLSGGFALLQYDAASADDIEWGTSYGWGVLIMNVEAAPLIFITEGSSSIDRTATTSLHNLQGSRYSLDLEKLFSPFRASDGAEAVLMPVMTPSSNMYRSMRSRWACSAESSVYDSAAGSRSVNAGFGTFYVDHGLCLGGGANVYAG